jgi:methylenetetrahydrofolate dehydrogenase (NADP+)/methenyltetrahydrofolate cyclohydrolase
MKILSGSDLAGFIMQRQAQQVRGLKLNYKNPKLAIVQTLDDDVINTYVRLKIAYGEQIGVDVEKHFVAPEDIQAAIDELNQDDSVSGIIVQLPLEKSLDQQSVLNLVAKQKDVDGLSDDSPFDPATPIAIQWLLSGYNIDMRGKKFVVVGQGALVGSPMARLLENSGHEVITADEHTQNLSSVVAEADILITAVGQPSLITSAMIPENSVVIDAGVAVDSGVKRGDLADDVYERDDLKITPKIGGVGPLTVSALFDNVIRATDSQNE